MVTVQDAIPRGRATDLEHWHAQSYSGSTVWGVGCYDRTASMCAANRNCSSRAWVAGYPVVAVVLVFEVWAHKELQRFQNLESELGTRTPA